ncbi:unnamed protein product [Arctogadus glacialis]
MWLRRSPFFQNSSLFDTFSLLHYPEPTTRRKYPVPFLYSYSTVVLLFSFFLFLTVLFTFHPSHFKVWLLLLVLLVVGVLVMMVEGGPNYSR